MAAYGGNKIADEIDDWLAMDAVS